MRVVAPLGVVTPASPSNTSSLPRRSAKASRVVCQRDTGVALRPSSPLTARVSGVTGGASALAPLRVMPRASLLW